MTATPQSLAPTTQDAIPHISKLSHLMDDMEQLADDEFFTIAHGSPQALGNLLARLERLQLTIEMAAGLAQQCRPIARKLESATDPVIGDTWSLLSMTGKELV